MKWDRTMGWSVTSWILVVIVLLLVGGCTEGFQWESEDPLVVNGCVGSSVTIPWKFTKLGLESLQSMHWFRFSTQTVASVTGNTTTNPDPRFKPSQENAELDLQSLMLADTGHYQVDVKLLTKNHKGQWDKPSVHHATAVLFVRDPPSLSGKELKIKETTSQEMCALQRQVTLTCGHFSSRGFPPVDVVWTDPAGQKLSSTRFTNGNFELDLPRRPLTGNYTCSVHCENPVLQCLDPGSPVLDKPQIHVQAPTADGCTDAYISEPEPEGSTSPIPHPQVLERLQSNVTELRQDLVSLQDQQNSLKEENEQRTEDFQTKVEDLQELVVRAFQSSSGAQFHVLQQMVTRLQQTVEDLQQNVSTLQEQHRGNLNDEAERQQHQQQQIQGLTNKFQDLNDKLQLNRETTQSMETKVGKLREDLLQTRATLVLLEDSMNENVAERTGEDEDSQRHAERVAELWLSLNRLEDRYNDTVDEMTEVREAQRMCERRQDSLTETLTNVSSQVVSIVQVLPERVDQALSESQATQTKLTSLGQRLNRVENGQPLTPRDDTIILSGRDPLVSKAVPTMTITSPWNGEEKSVFHDFLITPEGRVVIADRLHANVIMAYNASSDDVTTRPLRHGTQIRRLTNMEGGKVAATVDDHYICIVDTTNTDSMDSDRWVRTPVKYGGIAARSAQTLFVGVDSDDADSVARIDVISVVEDTAVVLYTLLNQSVTAELRRPASLTVHDDHLYICDWDSSKIIRLSLQTLQVTVFSGPRAEPELHYYQPRGVVFDVSGNMYVATGGGLCGGVASYRYLKGFCVVVVSQEGWWGRLILKGQHIYPYALSLTPSGLAVSWVSWMQMPVRSLVQWYDLVKQHD